MKNIKSSKMYLCWDSIHGGLVLAKGLRTFPEEWRNALLWGVKTEINGSLDLASKVRERLARVLAVSYLEQQGKHHILRVEGGLSQVSVSGKEPSPSPVAACWLGSTDWTCSLSCLPACLITLACTTHTGTLGLYWVNVQWIPTCNGELTIPKINCWAVMTKHQHQDHSTNGYDPTTK